MLLHVGVLRRPTKGKGCVEQEGERVRPRFGDAVAFCLSLMVLVIFFDVVIGVPLPVSAKRIFVLLGAISIIASED